MRQEHDTIDNAALALGGALIALGTVVSGIVEILAGRPYGATPVELTNDAGTVVETLYPAVDPTLRTGLVIAGLLVLFVWGLYRIVDAPAERVDPTPADVGAD